MAYFLHNRANSWYVDKGSSFHLVHITKTLDGIHHLEHYDHGHRLSPDSAVGKKVMGEEELFLLYEGIPNPPRYKIPGYLLSWEVKEPGPDDEYFSIFFDKIFLTFTHPPLDTVRYRRKRWIARKG